VSVEFLDLDTPIYIVDEPLNLTKAPRPPTPEASRKSASPSRSRKPQARTPTRKPSTASIPPSHSTTIFPTLDYTNIAKHLHNDGDEDPLADTVYFTQHRRAERKEKQLRNIEKDRAMHEKAQLERLLDGLQGPDWLKVMGITGVTDGERKRWESKRDYFIKEVQALVDKFRLWKEQEKKVRAEKEAAQAARDDEDDEDDESESGTCNGVHRWSAHRDLAELGCYHCCRAAANRHQNTNLGNLPPNTVRPIHTQENQMRQNPVGLPGPTASSSPTSPPNRRLPSYPSTVNLIYGKRRLGSTDTDVMLRRLVNQYRTSSSTHSSCRMTL
jgi:hypothetical protein